MKISLFLFLLIFSLSCSEDKSSTNNSSLACMTNIDCESTQSCIQGNCIQLECRLNSDCTEGLLCQDNQCVLAQNCTDTQCPCEKNIDCLESERCALDSKSCVLRECYSDLDCALEYLCIERKCEIDTNADRDRDLVPDAIDVCPLLADAMQEDLDGDMLGDLCDDDDDNDGVNDQIDNCPLIPNTIQGDADLNLIGNACDPMIKGTTLTGKLNLLNIQLGNYTSSSLVLENSTSSAVIQQDGHFSFEQAISENPNIALFVNLKGYQPQRLSANVNLKESSYDLGNIDLMPISQPLYGRVQKELSQIHEQIAVAALIDQQQIDRDLTMAQGEFSLNSYQSNQKLIFSSVGYLPLEVAVIWNDRLQIFEFLDENQQTTPLSQGHFILKRDLSHRISGDIQSSISNYQYELIDFRLIELATQEERQLVIQANGHFELDRLAQGLYRMEINAQGHLYIRELVQLQAGLNDLGIISLTPELQGEQAYLLHSQVRLNGSAQHGGIQIRAMINQESQGSDISAPDGSYALRLNRLNHRLSFYKDGYISQNIDILWNEEQGIFTADNQGSIRDIRDIEVVLFEQNQASLQFQLLSDILDFEWSTKCVIYLQNLNTNQTRQLNATAQGFVEITNLNVGIYQIEIQAEGHLPYLKALNIHDGINQISNIQLITQVFAQQDYLLQSKVLLNDKNQHNGIQIRALINQQTQASELSAPDGSYALHLNKLDQELSFYKEGYVSQSLRLRWDEGLDKFIVLQNGESIDMSTLTVILEEDIGPNGDVDEDGISNAADNCFAIANENQLDSDRDGQGDECDDDDDDDGLDDITELLIGSNPLNQDSDADGINDFQEKVILGSSAILFDSDGDGENDLLETGNDISHPLDIDGDGIIDSLESTLRDSDRDGANDEIDGPSDLGDLDGDGIANVTDSCVLIKNSNQSNLDNDEYGDECDDDDDNDLVPDALDSCPRLSNTTQRDTDLDSIGDECDDDDDNDGLADLIDPYPLLVDFDQDGILDGDGQNAVDNCPGVANVNQRDNDLDDEGDACDTDDDNDGVLDDVDNCSLISNPQQLNSEPTPDSFGDACDLDDDNDGILDSNDNCPLDINVIQSDLDYDGLGNACDSDDDGDGILDIVDNCPTIRNPTQIDTNGDGIGNACAQDADGDGFADVADNCPNQYNIDQKNIDNDSLGDACDPDIDGDQFLNQNDSCVFIYNNPQFDLDGDLIGDPCDEDDDNDQINDIFDSCQRIVNVNADPDGDNIDSACDNCPLVDNRYQIDIDKDGLGDACDLDIDNDGFSNDSDNCPKLANLNQRDSNGNGIGDACELKLEWYVSDGFSISDTANINQKLFIATDGGGILEIGLNSTQNMEISRYHHTMTDGLPSHQIKMLAVDQNENIWAVSPLGLSVRYQANSTWETFKSISVKCGAQDLNIDLSAKIIDLDVNRITGEVYIAFEDKVIRKQGDLLSCFEKGTGLLNSPINSVDISPDGEAVWIGTQIGVSKYIEGTGWQSYVDIHLGFSVVKQVGFVFENARWHTIVMNDLNLNPMITKINYNGSIDGQFKNIISALPSFYYTEDKLGSNGIDKSIFIPQSIIPPVDFNLIKSSNGDFLLNYFSSNNTNVIKRFNPSFILENTNIILNDSAVPNAVAFDDQGGYYIASNNGLYSSKDNFQYTIASGLPSNTVNAIAIDQNQTLWIATNNGLSYYRNGFFTNLASGERCTKILIDDNNIVWVIKKGNLFSVENDQFVPAIAQYPLLRPITDLEIDENGELWSNIGLKLSRRSINLSFEIMNQNRFIGMDIEPLTENRLISTYNNVVIFNYANQSQRNISVGTISLRPMVYRSPNGVEAWVVGKGSFAKIIGWELDLDQEQLDGNALVYDFLPTMIKMPNRNYEIAKTETTQEQYKFCVDMKACSNGVYTVAKAKHPVHSVSWYDAKGYAEFIGGNLPSFDQWSYAATGGGRNILYPWGNSAPTCLLANYYGCVGGSLAVCSLSAGITPQGVCDMAGNVFEWNLDLFSSSTYVFTGGGWNFLASALLISFKSDYAPTLRYGDLGFRTARTTP